MLRRTAAVSFVVVASLVPLSVGKPGERGVADLYKPGEERVWIFKSEGRRIGFDALRYEGPVDLVGVKAHRFTSRVKLDATPAVGIPEQRYLGELITDDAGHPIRHVLEATVGSSYSRVELSVTGLKAEVVMLQGRTPKTMTVDVPAGTYLQANNFIGYFELMLSMSQPATGNLTTASLLSTNVLQVIPYRAKKQAAAASAPAGTWKLEDTLGEVITWSAKGGLLEIEVAPQNLKITRSDEKPETFVIARPSSAPAGPKLDREPVEIRHKDVVLAGEITRKPGSKGKLPAVFFISGSGQQDRDGSSSGLDIGTHEILDRLSEEGFAVLRVDDRGAGGSKGPTDNLSFDDLVADARACVDFLMARADVDPSRVALIGHSEGGVTAPILAVERPKLAAIVLMAGTGRSILEVMLEQNAHALDLAGVKGEEREKTLADVKKYLELAASDARVEARDLPADYRSLLSARAWLQSHARQDPRKNIGKVRCPILILQGEKDFQVSTARDARVLAEALDEAKHADHELIVFPDLDHLFKKVKGNESKMADYFEARPVDAAFLDALSSWLKKRLHP